MFLALAVASYLLGAVPVGVLVARAKGVDILHAGSGNIGATNVARVLGGRAGALVFALDVVKGLLPALAGWWIAPGFGGLSVADQSLIFGVLAIAGHLASPFLKFRGGKGVATGLGALAGTAPIVAGIGLLTFVLVMVPTRYVSLSSLFAATAVIVSASLTGQSSLFLGVYTLIVLYVFYKHRGNIARLAKGEEPRFRETPKQQAVDQ